MLSEISPCIVNRQQQQNVQCNHSNNMSRKKNVPYDINDNNVGEHPKIKKKCFVMTFFIKFNATNVLSEKIEIYEYIFHIGWFFTLLFLMVI